MDYTTFENLFIAIMTPLSVGFFLLMVGVFYYEFFRLLILDIKRMMK